MVPRIGLRMLAGTAAAVTVAVLAGALALANVPVAIDSATVTISGMSGLKAYTATTSAVRVTSGEVTATASDDFWTTALKPEGVGAFEVAIPSSSITSERPAITEALQQALKSAENPDITFRLVKIDTPIAGVAQTKGVLKIAGVEHEVTFAMKVQERGMYLTVSGRTDIAMNDFGIDPPAVLVGLVKTNPKVTVSFEAILISNRDVTTG